MAPDLEKSRSPSQVWVPTWITAAAAANLAESWTPISVATDRRVIPRGNSGLLDKDLQPGQFRGQGQEATVRHGIC
ncbi:hypothetical protein PG987_010291 [Apiospora arundinis]